MKTVFLVAAMAAAATAQQGCTQVSVEGDATYCVSGAICGGNGSNCPKKGDVAVKDCVKNVRSYVDAARCVAPEDASCKKIKTGAWGCVWNSQAPQKDAEEAEQQRSCSTNWSQCNGQNWPANNVCCQDQGFQCNFKNQYLSLCEPKPKKDAEDAEQATQPRFAQCGGQGYNGNNRCADNDKCQFWNQWYSQCVPKN
ncbi:Aste57867_7680 [Aphanomyces stellatus]|uniref:Aste57867_7680 protein n=1 Tax=Aphanomyces stellatus TaxID=120398 RepID=A0A485KIM0_9STRA|nr:hypothetical protein As57867_007652 [Aphanomyces stellatus]VFT84583.1 Aste57867_7680 [Aphanomyces stellatus]